GWAQTYPAGRNTTAFAHISPGSEQLLPLHISRRGRNNNCLCNSGLTRADAVYTCNTLIPACQSQGGRDMAGFTVVFLIWCCIAVPIGWGLARVESKVNNIPMRPTGARSVLLGLLAVTALMVAGCGGSHNTSGSGSRVGAGVLPNSPAAASSPAAANPTDW